MCVQRETGLSVLQRGLLRSAGVVLWGLGDAQGGKPGGFVRHTARHSLCRPPERESKHPGLTLQRSRCHHPILLLI